MNNPSNASGRLLFWLLGGVAVLLALPFVVYHESLSKNTAFAPGFSRRTFAEIAPGDTRASVEARLGPPLCHLIRVRAILSRRGDPTGTSGVGWYDEYSCPPECFAHGSISGTRVEGGDYPEFAANRIETIEHWRRGYGYSQPRDATVGYWAAYSISFDQNDIVVEGRYEVMD